MSSSHLDYYEILKISKTATTEEIRSSYKNLAKQHHPDKGGYKEKFQEIQTAYEILSDDNKKKEYDFQRNNGGIPNFFHQQHQILHASEWQREPDAVTSPPTA